MRAALAAVGMEVLATNNDVYVNHLYDALVENNGAVYDGNTLSNHITIPDETSLFFQHIADYNTTPHQKWGLN